MVEEFYGLISWGGAGRFTKMAIPLTFGHLVRVTCKRAGDKSEVKGCFRNFASKYVKEAWDKYKATDDHQEKGFILSVLSNMRFGGHSSLMMPLIKGEMEQCNQLRTMASWAAGMVYYPYEHPSSHPYPNMYINKLKQILIFLHIHGVNCIQISFILRI